MFSLSCCRCCSACPRSAASGLWALCSTEVRPTAPALTSGAAMTSSSGNAASPRRTTASRLLAPDSFPSPPKPRPPREGKAGRSRRRTSRNLIVGAEQFKKQNLPWSSWGKLSPSENFLYDNRGHFKQGGRVLKSDPGGGGALKSENQHQTREPVELGGARTAIAAEAQELRWKPRGEPESPQETPGRRADAARSPNSAIE